MKLTADSVTFLENALCSTIQFPQRDELKNLFSLRWKLFIKDDLTPLTIQRALEETVFLRPLSSPFT